MLTGEPLALDLVNTRARTPDGEIDHLGSTAGLEAWLHAEADRLDAVPTEPREQDAAAVRALRGHIDAVLAAARRGDALPAASIAAINQAARAAPVYPAITIRRSEPEVLRARAGHVLDQLLAQLAEAAIDILTSPRVRDIRTCEGPTCRMIFLPAHPRRRWCSPELCGNRARVARYYQRHRADRS